MLYANIKILIFYGDITSLSICIITRWHLSNDLGVVMRRDEKPGSGNNMGNDRYFAFCFLITRPNLPQHECNENRP